MSNKTAIEKEVLDNMNPETVLNALRGFMENKTAESDAASEAVAKAFEAAGLDIGPKPCRHGYVQRSLMAYASERMIRQLHQLVAQKEHAE